MTVTYNLSTLIGQVRLKIGDTDITNDVFTDEELQVFLDESSNGIPIAAALACEAWASKYGANASEEEMGNYRYNQKIIDNLLKMAARFRQSASEGPPQQEISSMDLTFTPGADSL